MLIVKFVHVLSVTLWIGGAVAAFAVATSTRGQAAPVRAAGWPLLARIHGFVIAPGAIAAVLTGLILTMQLTSRGMGAMLMNPGILGMQFAGLLSGTLVVFVGVPTANQLAAMSGRIESDVMPAPAERLRRRQAVVSTLAGVFAILALFMAEVVRYL